MPDDDVGWHDPGTVFRRLYYYLYTSGIPSSSFMTTWIGSKRVYTDYRERVIREIGIIWKQLDYEDGLIERWLHGNIGLK